MVADDFVLIAVGLVRVVVGSVKISVRVWLNTVGSIRLRGLGVVVVESVLLPVVLWLITVGWTPGGEW